MVSAELFLEDRMLKNLENGELSGNFIKSGKSEKVEESSEKKAGNLKTNLDI